MGDFNRPEIASLAGETSLVPDSSGDFLDSPGGGESDEEMEEPGPLVSPPINQHLVQVAESTLKITETNGPDSEDTSTRSERPRPTIVTGQNQQAGGAALRELVHIPDQASQEPGTQVNGASPLGRDSHGNDGDDPGQQAHLNPTVDEDSIATSPRLRQYAIIAPEGSPMETLPAMQTSPPLSANSPGAQQSLPSIHTQLGPLADRPPIPQALSLSNRPSYPGKNSLHSPPTDFTSPRGPPPYPPLSARTNGSYPSAYSGTEPSPASTQSGPSPREAYAPGHTPRSTSPPPSKFGPRQYSGTQGLIPSEIPTPISASSQASYRTLGTEPSPVSERTNIDPERTLPPLTNGPLVSGGFKCDHPGCTAPPFQTQYLLNSHANVHSQNRPHYCPVKNCSRSEGGKGFKRKNEMIRHGLVHQSPGYICPFCPEREHKYPRPDNLQRHVRVHHVDKDKDDPQLREVLSQRPEGGNRGRRKRANS